MGHVFPQARTGARLESGAASCVANVLAWETTGEHVDGFDVGPVHGGDVAEVGHVWPVVGEHRARGWVDFAEPRGVAAEDGSGGHVEAAVSSEQRTGFHANFFRACAVFGGTPRRARIRAVVYVLMWVWVAISTSVHPAAQSSSTSRSRSAGGSASAGMFPARHAAYRRRRVAGVMASPPSRRGSRAPKRPAFVGFTRRCLPSVACRDIRDTCYSTASSRPGRSTRRPCASSSSGRVGSFVTLPGRS